MPIFKPRPNGNMIVDEIIEDVSVDGMRAFNVEKCPNVYAGLLDEEIYEGLSLRDIFEINNLFQNDLVAADNASLVSYIDNVLVYENTNQISVAQTSSKVSVTLGEKVFMAYDLKVDRAIFYSNIYLRDISSTVTQPDNTLIPNQYNTYTAVKEITATGESRIAVRIILTGEEIYSLNELKSIYFIPLNIFTTAPSQMQLDSFLALYLYFKNSEGTFTGTAVVGGLYIDYDNEIAHNLTTIYGTGNEPTLETHETLIPQYTNVVVKAPAFANDLQNELMTVKKSDKIGGAVSFADLEALQLVSNGDFEDDTNADGLADGWTTSNATYNIIEGKQYLYNNGVSYYWQIGKPLLLSSGIKYYFLVNYKYLSDAPYLVSMFTSSPTQTIFQLTNQVELNERILSGTWINNTNSTYIYLYTQKATTIGLAYYVDNFNVFNITALQTAQLYSSLYDDTFDNLSDAEIKAQMDLWIELLNVLNGSTTKTGTAFLGSRYYVDYDNLKVYDYDKASPYVTSTPADKEAFMEDVLAHNVVVNFPIKARIRKDKLTILGDYIVVGAD